MRWIRHLAYPRNLILHELIAAHTELPPALHTQMNRYLSSSSSEKRNATRGNRELETRNWKLETSLRGLGIPGRVDQAGFEFLFSIFQFPISAFLVSPGVFAGACSI
jgi:hypothetical protein